MEMGNHLEAAKLLSMLQMNSQLEESGRIRRLLSVMSEVQAKGLLLFMNLGGMPSPSLGVLSPRHVLA